MITSSEETIIRRCSQETGYPVTALTAAWQRMEDRRVAKLTDTQPEKRTNARPNGTKRSA